MVRPPHLPGTEQLWHGDQCPHRHPDPGRPRCEPPPVHQPGRRQQPDTAEDPVPGHMVHVDIKKVGRIPDGGGWRVHGKGSVQAKAAARAKARGARAGYTCTRRSMGTRIWPTPKHYRMKSA